MMGEFGSNLWFREAAVLVQILRTTIVSGFCMLLLVLIADLAVAEGDQQTTTNSSGLKIENNQKTVAPSISAVVAKYAISAPRKALTILDAARGGEIDFEQIQLRGSLLASPSSQRLPVGFVVDLVEAVRHYCFEQGRECASVQTFKILIRAGDALLEMAEIKPYACGLDFSDIDPVDPIRMSSIVAFSLARSVDPTSTAAARGYVSALKAAGRFDRAIDFLQSELARSKDNASQRDVAWALEEWIGLLEQRSNCPLIPIVDADPVIRQQRAQSIQIDTAMRMRSLFPGFNARVVSVPNLAATVAPRLEQRVEALALIGSADK